MKFKANFSITTPDFKKHDWADLQVTTNINPNQEFKYEQIEFKMTIPSFMFDELADSENQFTTEGDINKQHSTGNYSKISGCFADKEISRKFKKTQTAKTLKQLQDYMFDLTSHLTDIYGLETISSKKKIFIKFTHSKNHTTNNWCGSYRGEAIGQTFNYFLGYEILVEKNNKQEKQYITKIEYHSKHSTTSKRDTGFKEGKQNLPLIGHQESKEQFENNFSIIDWTEEREAFCVKIQDTFENVNAELSKFLRNLDSDKMDLLMAGNSLKFLNK